VRRFFALELLDNRYPQLHGIRVFAIISVVQFHVTSIFALEQSIRLDHDWVMSSLAVFFGMDLFFILSGFLIGTILLYGLKHRDEQKHPIRRFYLRRIFRTFPAYYAVLTILAIIAFAYTPTALQKKHIIWEYLYATNFFSTARVNTIMSWGWSLSLEEQFYLVVPLLFFLLRFLKGGVKHIAFLVVMWASALVVRLTIYLTHTNSPGFDFYGALYFKTYTRYDTFVAGILLAVAHDRYREPIGNWLMAPFHRALVALPSMLCLWMLARPWTFAGVHMSLFHVFAWGTLTTIMWTGFLLLLLHGHGPVHTLLSAPIFRRVATLGYGVYLVHIPLCDNIVVPLAHALDKRHVPLSLVWMLSFSLLIALSLGVAYVLHLLVEKPSLWVRDRVAA
jgi:peptidoglycan/LPS O-acetylase OafA/YrhL